MGKGKKKEKKLKNHPRLRLALKISLLLFLITILIVLLVFYKKYGETLLGMRSEAKKYIKESTEDTFRASETSLVYDKKGNLLSVLKGEKDVYYLPYSEIPQYAKDAMVVTEDKNFFKHSGVDYKSIVRAMVAFVRNEGQIKQGASTITQQLSRNVFLTHNVTWDRKIREMFIALEMEKKYNKEQILEFYLNNIYFANGYYGIEAASKGYFNRSSSELTLGEIIFLCAIPNNPTLYDPLDHMDNTLKRKNRVLDQMLADGVITDKEYQEAVNQEIVFDIQKVKKQDYVQTYVNYCATRALMKKEGFEFRNEFSSDEDKEAYNEQYNELYSRCQRSLYYSGYRIYTSIEPAKQKKLQNAVNTELNAFKEKTKEGIFTFQGSAVCIDNKTGRVVAVVGGRSQNSEGYSLNRAFQSFRQPGSSIKPLLVYTPAFDKDYSPNDSENDIPIKDGPSNSDGKYSGYISLRKAVEVSKNTIAWNLYEKLGPKKCMPYLLEMGFSRIVKDDYYLASALGGFTIGASPIEMTAGYATLANDGEYREPTCIIKITDSKGEEIVGDDVVSKRVYKKNSARMMTDVLTGVLTNGTGRGLALTGMSCAGKTGTTNEKKDGWFVGYTPYYTTGVWVGYDTPKSVSDLSGATYPGRIWKAFMQEIHEGLEDKAFPEYEDKKPVYTQWPKATPKPTKDTKNIEDELDYIEEDVEDVEEEEEDDDVTFEEDDDVPIEDPDADTGEPIEQEDEPPVTDDSLLQ